MEEEARVALLAEILGHDLLAARSLKSMLYEYAVDYHGSSDLSAVSTAQWALAFGIPPGDVPELLGAFVASGFLERQGESLELCDWEQVVAEASARSAAGWLESSPDTATR